MVCPYLAKFGGHMYRSKVSSFSRNQTWLKGQVTTTIGISQGKSPPCQVWLVINIVVVDSDLSRDLAKPRNQRLCDFMGEGDFHGNSPPCKTFLVIDIIVEEL